MDPELVLVIVWLALFSGVVWLAGVSAGWVGDRRPHPERAAWWRLVMPLFTGLLVLALLVGWRLQEPNPVPEHIGRLVFGIALLNGGIVLRAGARAIQSLRPGTDACASIGTIGLLRPRVVVCDEFQRSVSEDGFAAAMAHETAHVKRRDPLRIWLAQLAADLQWPVPGTRGRFSAWVLALEAARDDETVATGTAGDDLAEAILAAARLHASPRGLCAHAEGGGEWIAWRVRRLLSGAAEPPGRRSIDPWAESVSCVGLLVAAAWLGLHHGEAFLGALLGKG